jgi:two-component system OmpR family response regulator
MRVLLVEDDAPLAEELAGVLRQADFAVDHCRTGEEALEWAEIETYDAAILDVGLPRMDGLAVVGEWRKRGVVLPVLILTARDRFADLVSGFKAGADDFLRKPFRNEEVVLRLYALIRRGAAHAQPVVACGELALDSASGELTLSGLPMRLTAFERRVLRYLLHRRGAVVSRTELSEHVYERETDRDFNSLEVIVSRLRRKIGDCRIESLRGEGYLLKAGDDA